MSNLGLGQTAWNKLFKEFGAFLKPSRCAEDMKRRFNRRFSRTQIDDECNVNGFTSSWTLSGVQIGINTHESGKLYVRIADETPGANQATVSLYKATGAGGSDKVAEGSGNNGATITLSAANSSGLTGTVKLGTVSANEATDAHYLEVFPDFTLIANALFDGSEPEHGELLDVYNRALEQSSVLMDAILATWKAATDRFVLTRIANEMKSGQSGSINRGTVVDDGVVTLNATGVLEDLRTNMEDETTPAEQTCVQNTVSGGAGTFDSKNQGAGTMAAPSIEEWAKQGTVTFVCVDATIGREEFEVTQKLDTTGTVRTAQNRLRVNKEWSDPEIGILQAVLERSPTITHDSGTDDFGTVADWDISGESSKNTSDGIIYLKIAAGTVDPAKFTIKLYKSASYATASLVAITEEGAANGLVGINARNGSGLSGTAKLGSAPDVGDTGYINLKTFRTENTYGRPDKFTVAITRTSAGEFQDRIGEQHGYAVNSAASGAETISENYAKAATFPAYAVRDV